MNINTVPIIATSKALNYYEGIRYRPKLLATTLYRPKLKNNEVEEPSAVELSGNQAWVNARKEIIAHLKSEADIFTAIQPVRFKRDRFSKYPLTLWVQKIGHELSAAYAAQLAWGCLDILEKHRLLDMQVEIHEPSSPFRQHFYRLLPSQPSLIGGSELPELASDNGFCYEENAIWSIMEVSEILLPVRNHKITRSWDRRMAKEIHESLSLFGVQWSSLDIVRYNEFRNLGSYKNRHDDFPVILWVGVLPGSLSVASGMCVAKAVQNILKKHGIEDVRVQLRESEVTINHCSCETFDPADITDLSNCGKKPELNPGQARLNSRLLKSITSLVRGNNINVGFEKIDWKCNTLIENYRPSPKREDLEISVKGLLKERNLRDTERIKGPLRSEVTLQRLNTVLFEQDGEVSVGQLNNVCSYIRSNGMILKRWPVFPFVPPKKLIEYHSRSRFLIYKPQTTCRQDVAFSVAKPFSKKEDVGSLVATIDGKVAGALDGGAGNRGLFDISYLVPVNKNFKITDV